MRLDFNYNENTHLREWWKQVYNNFSKIEKEFNENEDIWNNACTKSQVKEYIAEIVNSEADVIAAINVLKTALEQDENVAETVNTMVNKRVPSENEITDADLCFYGIYTGVCENTPQNQRGIIIAFDDMQLFMTYTAEDKNIYKRYGYNEYDAQWFGAWEAINREIEDKIDICIQNLSNKQEKIIFGTYVGDDTSTSGGFSSATSENERFIELGFTPLAVEVVPQNGASVLIRDYDSHHFGGLATFENDCVTSAGKLISIVENGFKIYNNHTSNKSGGNTYNKINAGNNLFFYKAYKT